MKNILWIFGLLLLLTSCGSDDDICLSSDSTPRLKLKFLNANNNLLTTLDSLYVDVDYGTSTTFTNIISSADVDSVFVPMRIDENGYTDIYFRSTKNGSRSKIRVNYETKSIYVSPACGFKRNYENLNAELLESNPVQSIQTNITALSDENSINFYLRF